MYPVAIPLAWLIIKFTNISANKITVFSLVLVVVASIITTYTHNLSYILIGFIVFYVLDYVDGKVAYGRGEGSLFGAKLDYIVDRTVVAISVVTLSYYHMIETQLAEMFLLNIFGIWFFWLDSVAYASFVKVVKEGKYGSTEYKEQLEPYRGIKIFLSFKNWIPNRLNSYLFIIIGYILSSSYVLAYLLGSIVLLLDMIMNYFNGRDRRKK